MATMTPEEATKFKIAAAEKAHDVENNFIAEANKAAVNSGAVTLKAILYLNGGSCVIMLAFLGTLASKDKPISGFAIPIVLFAMGAALAVLANAGGYFTNLLISGTSTAKERSYEYPFLRDTDTSRRRRWWGEFCRYATILLAICGLVCFFTGLGLSYGAFKGL
jgi:hypothetical protein